MRLIAGTAFGERAPTPTFSPIFYVAVEMDAGAVVVLGGDPVGAGVDQPEAGRDQSAEQQEVANMPAIRLTSSTPVTPFITFLTSGR